MGPALRLHTELDCGSFASRSNFRGGGLTDQAQGSQVRGRKQPLPCFFLPTHWLVSLPVSSVFPSLFCFPLLLFIFEKKGGWFEEEELIVRVDLRGSVLEEYLYSYHLLISKSCTPVLCSLLPLSFLSPSFGSSLLPLVGQRF